MALSLGPSLVTHGPLSFSVLPDTHCFPDPVGVDRVSAQAQDGVQKSWDFMKTHDSVTILMFNSSRRSLVLVKQFRPAVYAGEVERLFPGSLAAVERDQPQELKPALPGSVGVMVELCAGIVDQPGLSLEEVACKEAWEECGYRLDPADLRQVATYMSGVGLTGSRQTMFYTEVTDAQRGGPGGGLAEEGELIEVVHLSLDDAQAFADNPNIPKTLGVIFAISWFFSQVAPHLSLHRDSPVPSTQLPDPHTQ
ncbi:uridine diphosphate glucose pyrophosphatase NUDT14 isoform X3 [Mesocricetus auratus]|uniref:Uridine diphosphate glucose pyrophosphatase NUDT14 isoform X3 n=1 Tax=Mesocricetus auratus TaxID=10036 RepID=A0ABM2X5Y6_MESAU|nr:uridine diphosphate glucose pyrophosphatase NUDT14 isoform X3 [Mesocricetus auratus]